ncbi:MAG TPA: hypothetical protein VLS27_17020, partial [Gammaproteobacteria bacterium]|nr:hypothetical protein [Gammaproteobacteria bacterium]
YVQPSIFTFGSILIVWIIALGVIFGVPALRDDRGEWPPSARELVIGFYAVKFVFFGLVAATLMLALIYADQRRSPWVGALTYGLFFGGAAVNLALCHWAAREKQAGALLTPLFFSLPALPVAAPIVAFMWYGAGAIGGLVGSGRRRIASRVALGVFTPLSAYSVSRIYLAATAAPHVTIGGGVAGNAALALLFAGLAIAAWWLLKDPARPDAFRTSRRDPGGT